MTEQLYRWVKASERNPTEGDLYWVQQRLKDSDLETFPGTCNFYNEWEVQDDYEVVEWLEPIPSLNAGSPVFNTIKPVSNDKLLAEYSKLRPANEDRDKDYSPLQDLFMNEIAAHLKLYTNPEVFEKAWTASLFPERLTKACLRATEQYIDSRPSLDIDKVVEQLRNKSPYSRYEGSHERTLDDVWEECCDKLKELLNQSK